MGVPSQTGFWSRCLKTPSSSYTFTPQLWLSDLGSGQSSPELVCTLSDCHLYSLSHPHLGTPWAGLFVPSFPGSAAGAVGWGGSGGRSRKSVGGCCLLVPKANMASHAPSPQCNTSPNSHTGISSNKINFSFFFLFIYLFTFFPVCI